MKMPAFSVSKHTLSLLALFMAFLGEAFPQSTPDIVWKTNAYVIGGKVISTAFSSDGTMLANCLGRNAQIWRVSDRSLIHSFSTRDSASAIAFSPDRSLLGAGDGYGNLYAWRLADGTMVTSGASDEGDNGNYSVTFSPDSRLLVRAARESGLRYILQAPTFTTDPPFVYPEEVGAFDVRFSPDGALLAAGFDDNTAKLFRMSEGRLLQDLIGHTKPVTGVDFSPDGTLLATAAADGDARLWRVPDGTLVRTIQGGGGSTIMFDTTWGESVGRLHFSADGKSLLTSSNGTLRFWSVSDGRLLLSYPNLEIRSFAVSPDGRLFAYGTDAIHGTNTAVVLARMPLLITDVSQANSQLILGWSGGSGLYQLQSTTNVAAGPWQNVGVPTTATAATNAVASTIFYRVQSLPNP